MRPGRVPTGEPDRRSWTVLALLAVLMATSMFYGSATSAKAQETASPGLEVTSVRLADGVHLFRAPSALDKWTSSNSVAILGDDGVVVFDTNTLPSTARSVLAHIRRLTDKPVTMVINSHWHMDHWSGNEVYRDSFPDALIVSTARTRDFMARMPSEFFLHYVDVEAARSRLDKALETGALPDGTEATDQLVQSMREDIEEQEIFAGEIAATRRVLPTMTYTDSLSLTVGGRELRLYSLTGDAAGSTVLYLPAENVLVAGDVLARREDGTGAQPWTMNSFAVSEWLAGLRKLESFGAAVIVPGQGPPLYDGAYLRTTIELYETLIAQTHEALEAGAVSVADVRAEVDVEDFVGRYGIDDPVVARAFEQNVVTILIRKIIEEAHDGVRPPMGTG